ncbi:hypothetical protein D3C78_1519280 [compost metagenome]
MQSGDEAVFTNDLVAFGELRDGNDLALHFLQLSRQWTDAHDRLQLVAKGAWVDLHGIAAQHATLFQPAQALADAGCGQPADLRQRLERAARVLHQCVDQ